MNTIEQFVAALKAHLTKPVSPAGYTHPITEIRFDDWDRMFEIDPDKLFAEIDKFAATFKVTT